ncbi:hypothetical protein GOV10_01905 [Candidatus Woesearchaeota archaeon]|nr:hypothetical protein [Candidatus Woesearchaeota archaeon]
MKWLVIIGLFILVACAKTEIIPEPTIVEPETVVEPEIIIEEIPETEEEIEAPEEFDEWTIPKNPLSSIVCEKEAKRLSFIVTNTDDTLWELGTIQPFPPPKDRISVSIFINGLDVMKEKSYFSEEKFSDCWDKETIEPGESFSCSLKPIPITIPNAYSRNYIQIQGNTINDQITYECE